MWKFLQSEKFVILGLTEDAGRTDANIADLYDLKKGTVASIRRRLLDAGALSYLNVPAFQKLGCEMIGFHLGMTEPAERSDARTNDYMEFCARSPQVFEGVIGGGSVVMYGAYRNATELDTFIQSHARFFSGDRRPSKARLHSLMFPFALSRFSPVPNFAAIVHRFFDLDVAPPKPSPPVHFPTEVPDLSATEKAVLVGMVENPMYSDRELASLVKLSRQAVTRIRNRLKGEGIVKSCCLPRLSKWGFEIMAVAHAKFNLEYPWEKRLKMQPRESVDLSFFTLSKADEAVSNYLIAKYSSYSEQLENLLAWYHKVGAFEEKPVITLLPLERCMDLRNFDYGPVVRNLLMGPQTSI